MQLSDAINNKWLDPNSLREQYLDAKPFPHIVMRDFIKEDILRDVLQEFPDLSKSKHTVKKYNSDVEVKLASVGMRIFTPATIKLNAYLQSDIFLNWLNTLTGIDEPLLSDPYHCGGGYHEIKQGGLLKVHADFNKHPMIDLDRRLNLLIYLNDEWNETWGGELQLFDNSMRKPIQSIAPKFNTAVIFSTTSFTYHGHPDALRCPEDQSRKSLAYYYFSLGRPKSEVILDRHTTIFKNRRGEEFKKNYGLRDLIRDLCPPIILKLLRKL